jgi:hypothetical protein
MPRSTLVEFLEIHGRIVASPYCAAACAGFGDDDKKSAKELHDKQVDSSMILIVSKELDDGGLIDFLKDHPCYSYI